MNGQICHGEAWQLGLKIASVLHTLEANTIGLYRENAIAIQKDSGDSNLHYNLS